MLVTSMDEKMAKIKATEKVTVGQIVSVGLADETQHRINQAVTAIELAKNEVTMTRNESKVLQLNIREGYKHQDSNDEKSMKIDKNYKKVHHRQSSHR